MAGAQPHARRVAADPGRAEVLPPRVVGDEPRRRPLRVTLISNPTSGRNARRGLLDRIDDVLARHPSVPHFQESTETGTMVATRTALANGAEIIAVNGGDGTVQRLLTAMLTAPATSLPILAVLAGGTTNTTARNLGFGRGPVDALSRLLEAAARGTLPGPVVANPVVRADLDLDDGPQYAMMFGAGAVYDGIVFARQQLASRGMRGNVGGAVALGTFLMKALTGKAGTLFPPLTAAIDADDVRLPPADYFGMLASTMDRQVLGVSPYWGIGPGRLRLSTMRYRPAHLARAVVPAVRGRPSRWLQPDFGYRSLNVDEVVLTFTGGFTLDGELFAPVDGERTLTLTARQAAYFLRSA